VITEPEKLLLFLTTTDQYVHLACVHLHVQYSVGAYTYSDLHYTQQKHFAVSYSKHSFEGNDNHKAIDFLNSHNQLHIVYNLPLSLSLISLYLTTAIL